MAIQRKIFDVLMNDGTEHLGVVTTMADQVKLSRTARTHKWDLDNAAGQIEGSVFLVWHALNRSGRYPEGYEAFVGACETVAPSEEHGTNGVELVDPTTPTTPSD